MRMARGEEPTLEAHILAIGGVEHPQRDALSRRLPQERLMAGHILNEQELELIRAAGRG